MLIVVFRLDCLTRIYRTLPKPNSLPILLLPVMLRFVPQTGSHLQILTTRLYPRVVRSESLELSLSRSFSSLDQAMLNQVGQQGMPLAAPHLHSSHFSQNPSSNAPSLPRWFYLLLLCSKFVSFNNFVVFWFFIVYFWIWRLNLIFPDSDSQQSTFGAKSMPPLTEFYHIWIFKCND